jgi:hypothetical protein
VTREKDDASIIEIERSLDNGVSTVRLISHHPLINDARHDPVYSYRGSSYVRSLFALQLGRADS